MTLPEAPLTPRLLALPQTGNVDTGFIAIAENGALPFAVARTYWTYLTPDNVMRGHHAHRSLQQLVFAVSGQLEISLEGPDGQRHQYLLSDPRVGLYIPGMYWRTIRFWERAVLLCLASEPYHEASYIRSYEEFRTLASYPAGS